MKASAAAATSEPRPLDQGRVGGHEPAGGALDGEAFALQLGQRALDGVGVHAQLGGEVAHARHPVAGRPGAGRDPARELVDERSQIGFVRVEVHLASLLY